ncbi:MAG: pyridoxamine 5'-phosphate oxidase family protein [Candidatus Nomurabacteria bacterium]|jgi:uncharacterized pyridoxamine 5'-phosphate oxidase family protein|nr:pyridoxamine 5'-phosphate oxidase family protein [Candidatus Nomurabacteria bacterium]
MIKLLRGVFYIATEDGDQPRVRAFDSCVKHNDRFYFETSSNKNVYRQLKANPKVEIIAHDEAVTVRVTAEAYEEENPLTVEEVENVVGKYMKNPTLAMFYLQNATAHLTKADGSTETFQF